MKRKLIVVAGFLFVPVALFTMVRLSDQSGYGKSAPPARTAWTVNAELPQTNSNVAPK